MTAHDAEIIVVGGGPAGAAASFFLSRAGCDVLLLDRAMFPRDKPCSEYLSPQASRLLHEIGVLDTLESGPSARLTGMRVHAPNGIVFEGSFGAPTGFRAFRDYGLAVRRPLLDCTLLSRAEQTGVRVRTGVDVRDLEFDSRRRVTGVVTRTDSGTRTLRARLVIGADGLRSVVARRARLGAHGRWPRRLALVRHFRGIPHDAQVGDMHVFDGGYAGFAPVGDGVTNVAVVIPTRYSHGFGNDRDAIMLNLLNGQPSIAARLNGAEPVTSAKAVGPFNWRARRAWTPGAVLVGDAADFFDPFTGEGMYAAMRGAELLTTYAFEAARSNEHRADIALDAYDRCRRREFAGKWAVERAIGAAVASPALMNRAARALANRPELADTLVGVTGDFIPASRVLAPRYILSLLQAALLAGQKRVGSPLAAPSYQIAGR